MKCLQTFTYKIRHRLYLIILIFYLQLPWPYFCRLLVLHTGAGRNSQVSAVRYNGANGDRRQREHSAQYCDQVRNPQTGRWLPRPGRQGVQPTDTRNTRRTGEIHVHHFNVRLVVEQGWNSKTFYLFSMTFQESLKMLFMQCIFQYFVQRFNVIVKFVNKRHPDLFAMFYFVS